jgi:hypothetical protein
MFQTMFLLLETFFAILCSDEITTFWSMSDARLHLCMLIYIVTFLEIFRYLIVIKPNTCGHLFTSLYETWRSSLI